MKLHPEKLQEEARQMRQELQQKESPVLAHFVSDLLNKIRELEEQEILPLDDPRQQRLFCQYCQKPYQPLKNGGKREAHIKHEQKCKLNPTVK